MKLTLLRADCDTGRTCPNINISDRGTLVVQGYAVTAEAAAATGARVPAGTRVVELPLSLIPELQDQVSSWPAVCTGRGTVMVWGPEVTDTEALAELAIPAGEAAIELPYDALPLKEVAHAG